MIFSPCFLLVSHRVFSIYYPKSIKGWGSTFGFWCINFFPDTFMHWVFKDKPPIQQGLVSVYILMEKCCAIWPEVSSVPSCRNPSSSSAFCPSPVLLSLLCSCRQSGREVMIKHWVLAVSGLRLGCPGAALALHKQGWQPLSSGTRPLALLHRISPQPGHPLQHLPDVFIALPETAFTTVLLHLLSLKQTQLMSHLS